MLCGVHYPLDAGCAAQELRDAHQEPTGSSS